MPNTHQLHFFAGKGGGGKTTLSAAHALNLLDKDQKRKVLLVAFEADSGLGDLLKKKLSSKPAKLVAGKGTGGVFAAELDLAELGTAFGNGFKAALAGSVQKGALLSQDELTGLLEASALNIGEAAAMFHFAELIESDEWDHIVIDGMSTAHALRQIDHAAWVRRIAAVVRGEKNGKALKNAPPRAPMPIDEYAQKADALSVLLKDPERFLLTICSVPEPVADAQVRFLVKSLEERGMAPARIIADMIEDGKGSREVANRRGLQAPHVRKFITLTPNVELIQRRVVGPRGLDELKKFAKDWASGKETKALAFSPAEAPPALVRAPSMPPIAAPPLPPTRFMFFVGSGGTGKSSCAAAAAVTLTEKEGPVLLISTDWSHSLSDVLQARLTDTETQVKGTKGLYAREIDFSNWYGNLRKRFKEHADQVFGPEARGEAFAQDKELLRNLFDLAPVGLDELAAMSALTDALVQERFKRIVIDPSPSGSTVRLLELPAVARGWLEAVKKAVVRHKAKGTAELVKFLDALINHVDRFEMALANPKECIFLVVTRGEDLAVPSAERLVAYLKDKKLTVDRVLVNRVLPKTTCPVTEERRKNELEVAKVLEKKVGAPVTLSPALGRHPAGLRELKAFRTSWYALSATSSKTRAA